jgi:HK97 family phage portal protein
MRGRKTFLLAFSGVRLNLIRKMANLWRNFRRKIGSRVLDKEARSLVASIDDPGILQILGLGNTTGSGIAVTSQTAMTVSAVYACVTLLADSVAKLPLKLYRKTADGREELVKDHRTVMLGMEPNSHQTGMEFRKLVQGLALLRGNGYARVIRNRYFEPIALEPLHPDKVSVHCVKNMDGTHDVVYFVSGEREPLRRFDDILHLPTFGTDGLVGISPIRLMAESVANSISYREQAGRMMQNGAKFPGFISTPNNLNEQQIDLMRRKWQEQHEGQANAGKTPILFGGVTWTSVGMSAEDAQLIQSRTFEVEEIARTFRVPLHMIQSTAKATSWGSGIEQMDRAFLNLSLDPHLVAWEQILDRTLLTQRERALGYYIKFNRNAIIQIAAKDFADIARVYRDIGVWSVNDVRSRLDQNDLPDNIGDNYALPFNGSGGKAAETDAPEPVTTIEDTDDE